MSEKFIDTSQVHAHHQNNNLQSGIETYIISVSEIEMLYRNDEIMFKF